MRDAETMKQAIAVVTVKAIIVAANKENRRQAMGIGHQNTAEISRLWTEGLSLRQPVLTWVPDTKIWNCRTLKWRYQIYS